MLSHLSLSAGALASFAMRHSNKLFLVVAGSVYALVSHAVLTAGDERPVRLRFDLSPLAEIPFVLQAHIGGAVLALFLGVFLLRVRSRPRMHRMLGYVWASMMAVTVATSFFLTGVNGDRLSYIHLLSGWTAIILPVAIIAARRRWLARHREIMSRLFFGALLGAGLFSFLPGRFMWQLFFTG